MNEDGMLDIISGSYADDDLEEIAGTFQVLWGSGNGAFKPTERLKGDNGEPLVIDPGKAKDPDGFKICTRPTLIDWDGDGKLDIVSGNFEGTFALFKGKGKGVFESKSSWIRAEGKMLKLSEWNSDPVFADIDSDGDLDLLSGSDGGGVFWAENKTEDAKVTKFELSSFKTLIEPNGYFLLGKNDEAKPGLNTRIWVDDLNGDGKTDILLGDTVEFEWVKEGIDKEAYAAWEKEINAFYESAPETDEELAALSKTQQEEFRRKQKELWEQEKLFIHTASSGHVWVYYGK